MYALWRKRLKQLNRAVKSWMREEKENRKTEVYVDLLSFKREHVSPAVKLYNRLNRQAFTHYRDEQALRLKIHLAVSAFNELVDMYSTPPNEERDPDPEVTALIDVDRFYNIQV